MGKPDGKVAFITGAGAGIAKASALAFAREGARVALAEISVGEPGHIASLVVYPASEDAHMINGTTIAADGGKSS